MGLHLTVHPKSGRSLFLFDRPISCWMSRALTEKKIVLRKIVPAFKIPPQNISKKCLKGSTVAVVLFQKVIPIQKRGEKMSYNFFERL